MEITKFTEIQNAIINEIGTAVFKLGGDSGLMACIMSWVSSSGKPQGAIAYEIGSNYIKVKFKSGCYKYSNNITGTHHVEAMKECALASIGLSTYIAKHRDMDFERC